MEGLQKLEEAVAALTADGETFALQDVEIRGHGYRSYRNQPANLAEYFKIMVGHGNKPFVIMGNERFGYAEAYVLAGRFAAALAERYGVAPGDRVAIAMRNNPQWILAFIGALRAGATAVPMNSWWTSEELEYGLEDCGAKLVIVDPDRAARIAPFAARLGLKMVGVGSSVVSSGAWTILAP